MFVSIRDENFIPIHGDVKRGELKQEEGNSLTSEDIQVPREEMQAPQALARSANPWIAKHKTEMLITLIAAGAILGFISTLIGVTGGLSIASGHLGLLSHLAPLNTAFTSIWKGLPYLLAAFGAPGVLLLLGAMIAGAYRAIRLLADRKSNKAAPKIEDESAGTPVVPNESCVTTEKSKKTLKERLSFTLKKISGRLHEFREPLQTDSSYRKNNHKKRGTS